MSPDALDVHLTVDQIGLYEETKGLARGELSEIAAQGEAARVNRPLIKALATHGLLDRLFTTGGGASATPGGDGPGRHGGEVSAIELCLIREALARHCTEAETAFALQGLGAYPIFQAGSDTIKHKWIPLVSQGTAVAAFALTEPDAGSDVSALSLTATRDPDAAGYRLTGEKLWISNAPDADIYTVFARTGHEGTRGITAFAVPGASENLAGEHKELLAPHAIGTLHFDGVYVPDDHVLGNPGEGFKVAMRTLDLFRPSVGAFGIGMARAAIDAATTYALERHTFGKPLKDHQAVAHRLADINARTHAARLLVHQAATAHDQNIHDPALAAMSKLLATEIAQEAVDFAIQVHGAKALEHGHPLEHLYRDVRAPRIYEGASEIQREIIARRMFRAAEQREPVSA